MWVGVDDIDEASVFKMSACGRVVEGFYSDFVPDAGGVTREDCCAFDTVGRGCGHGSGTVK